jgi:coenzyme F420-0:L-glutamate ligase/coenzyme F420-1:gamma-L-glutamate ligase
MSVQVLPVTGLGEIHPGDDLAAAVHHALELQDGDVVVVSSKVVSKSLGLTAPADRREDVIDAATVRLVARRRTPAGLARVVQAEAGPVMAAAGVDASNVVPGTVLLLPKDPDGEARSLRARLSALSGRRLGVVVSDTAGRAWREGLTDFALGAAGVVVLEDLRGAHDTSGVRMEVTVRAVADQLAAAADLVKGKLSGVPVAVLRGLPDAVTDEDGPGAGAYLRAAGQDWFRFGHVEAVRAALGVDPAAVEPPRTPTDDAGARLARVLDVALRQDLSTRPGSDPVPPTTAERTGTTAVLTVEGGAWAWFRLGELAQRVSAAAWTEDLSVRLETEPGPPPALRITAAPLR